LSSGQTICFGDVPHSLLASDAAHILPENKFTMRFRIIPVSQVLKHDTHCDENPIYVFPEKELRDLSPNFHIHVSVGDLSIPRTGYHIFSCSRMGRPIVGIYKSITHTLMWISGLRPRYSFSVNIYLEFSVMCRCSANLCICHLPEILSVSFRGVRQRGDSITGGWSTRAFKLV
jgi:hypothetical protein